jgi:hypothetical protein
MTLLRSVWLAGVLVGLTGAGPLAAQHTPFALKYGKWVALAAALGMGWQAAEAHAEADRAFDRLQAYCAGDPTRCRTGPNGRYLDPRAERFYQTSLGHDRAARRWLLGGEATFLGAAALFVWELTRPKQPPENIPFAPQVRVLRHRADIGVRVAF